MRAEYDHDNNRVIAVENESGRVTATQSARVLGGSTEWVPARIEYPEGYDQRFMSLLRPLSVRYDYDADTNEVVVRYPDADFSSEAIREELRQMIRGAARQVLNQSDWYIVRSVETGAPIPDQVREERDGVRRRVDEFERELEHTADDRLHDFSFTFTTDIPNHNARPKAERPPANGDGSLWVTDATHPGEQGKPVRPARPDEVGPIVPEGEDMRGMPNVEQIGETK